MSQTTNIRAIMESIAEAQLSESRPEGAVAVSHILFELFNDWASEQMSDEDGSLGMGPGGDANLAAFKVAMGGMKYTVQITKLSQNEDLQEDDASRWVDEISRYVLANYEYASELYTPEAMARFTQSLLKQGEVNVNMNLHVAADVVAKIALER